MSAREKNESRWKGLAVPTRSIDLTVASSITMLSPLDDHRLLFCWADLLRDFQAMIERKGQSTEIGTVWKSVSFRKLSFGTEAASGSQNMSVILSVVETSRRLKRHCSTFVKDAVYAVFGQTNAPRLIPAR